MIRTAAIAAVAFASFSGGVQEPPARFTTTQGAVRVEFYSPADVERMCGPSEDPERPLVLACCRTRPARLIMPNPWECGSDARCATLWRHEVAHCLKGWKHEPL